MEDFQGLKDSSDNFLSGNNFLLIRLSKLSTFYFFFQFMVFGSL